MHTTETKFELVRLGCYKLKMLIVNLKVTTRKIKGKGIKMECQKTQTKQLFLKGSNGRTEEEKT